MTASTMTFGQARRQLASHQKTAKGAPPYSRFVNRPMGRWFAAGAFVLGATPNQVTLASAACSAAGIAIIAAVTTSVWSATVAVVLLVIGYGLDSADGQLARLRGGGSRAGEWLDHTVDAAKISSLHLALAIALYRFGAVDPVWLLVPLGFTVTANVLFFSWILRDLMLAGTELNTNRAAGDEAPSVVGSLVRLLEDYGVLMLVVALLPATTVFLGAYGVLFGWSVVMTVLGLPRRFAAIDRVTRPGGTGEGV